MLILVSFCVFAADLRANPTAFAGATMLEAETQGDMQMLQTAYSFTHRFALGADYLYDHAGATHNHFAVARFNTLLYRWNAKEAQANLYAYFGLGAVSRAGTPETTGFGGAEADFETRTFYLSGKARAFYSGEWMAPLAQGRIGFAPYRAGIDALNTWILLQVQHVNDSAEHRLRVAPVLRFFYRNALAEVGVTTDRMFLMTLMVHL